MIQGDKRVPSQPHKTAFFLVEKEYIIIIDSCVSESGVIDQWLECGCRRWRIMWPDALAFIFVTTFILTLIWPQDGGVGGGQVGGHECVHLSELLGEEMWPSRECH